MVHITGEELGDETITLSILRERALWYARLELQGRSANNLFTNRIIKIGRKGINKTLNHSAKRVHCQSILALALLLEAGVLVKSERNRNFTELRSVPWVHTFTAYLRIGTTPYLVRLIIKETNEGLRFYDHDITAIGDIK